MPRILALFVVLLLGFFRPADAALISVGIFPATPSPAISIPVGTFLVPVDAQAAAGLQQWTFDLTFDNTVVQEVDPGDFSSGIYGADFMPGDSTSQSFILGGFPFNDLGLVSGISGEYPGLLDGVSGDGVLAYVLFQFVMGQEDNNPNFAIANASVTETVPEPSSLSVFGLSLLLMTIRRKLRLMEGTNA